MDFNFEVEPNYGIHLFENEYPEQAKFASLVFKAGGSFKRNYKDNGDVPPPRNVPRNAPCPCGSGVKTKKCHVEWTDKQAGFSEDFILEAVAKEKKRLEERSVSNPKIRPSLSLILGAHMILSSGCY